VWVHHNGKLWLQSFFISVYFFLWWLNIWISKNRNMVYFLSISFSISKCAYLILVQCIKWIKFTQSQCHRPRQENKIFRLAQNWLHYCICFWVYYSNKCGVYLREAFKVAEHSFHAHFCWCDSAHAQGFYLFKTCTICAIFLYYWTQCIDGFILLLKKIC